jgi:hypothetical protein
MLSLIGYMFIDPINDGNQTANSFSTGTETITSFRCGGLLRKHLGGKK